MQPDRTLMPGHPWPRRLPLTPTGVLLVALVCGLGALLATLSLDQSAIFVLACVLVALSFVDPAAALAGLILVIPFSTISTVEGSDFAVSAVEPVLALLLASWLAWGLARRQFPLTRAALLAPLGLVLVTVLLSVLSAQRIGLWLKESAKWLELMLVYAFTVAHLGQRRRQLIVLGAVLLAGAIEGFYGAFQYATGSGPAAFAVGQSLRAYGHFEQPNPFAGYLGTILPIALALLWWRRSRWLTALALLGAAGTGLGILLSQSRGAWLGLACALAVMLLAWSAQSRRLLALGVMGLPLLPLLVANRLVPASLTDRLTSIFENFGFFDVRTVQVTSENFALVERMAHWQAGWYMFLDHPILGVGAGNYPAAYDDYSLPGWREALGHAHNYYLNMAAETGLVGALALVLLLLAVYGQIARGLRRAPEGDGTRALLVGLLGSFAVLTVHNFFDNLLVHGIQVQMGFFMGLATLLASEQAPDGGGRGSLPPGRRAVST